MGGRTAAIRAGWTVTAAIACALVVPNFFHSPLGLPLIAGLLALGVTSAMRPFAGLLIFAGLAPLSTVIFILCGTPVAGFQFAEALAIVFIGGWAAGHALRPRPLNCANGVMWAAWVLIAMGLAWAIVEIRVWASQNPQTPLLSFLVTAFSEYLPPATAAPARSAMVWVESLFLLLAAADICEATIERRDAVLRVMVAGAAGAATLNVARYLQVVLAQEHPWRMAGHYFAHMRVSVQFPDVNAAGSYFAMIVIVAAGLVARSRRWPAAAVLAAALGVWLSGSRFALGAVILAGLLTVTLALKGRGRRALQPVVAAVALIGIITAAGWAMYPTGRNFLARKSLGIRTGLARGGFEMAKDHPIAGVGPGHFYLLSNQYAAEAIVPFGLLYENAHNNFVQVMAELGFPGLAVFVVLLTIALREATRSATPLPATSLGLVGGLVAYIITCVGGHPLLIPEAAYPFWIAVGLAAVPLRGRQPAPGWFRYTAAAAIVTLALFLPSRAQTATHVANMQNVSSGLSSWQIDPSSGQRYRTAGATASFYVPAGAQVVRLPLRSALEGAQTLEVEVLLDDRVADRILLPSDGRWYEKRLLLRGETRDRAFSKIELRVTVVGGDQGTSGTVIMIGRASLEWGR